MNQQDVNIVIIQAEMEQWRELDLSHRELSEFPIEIVRLHALEKLNLLGNQLKELPEEIGALSNLMELNLAQNCLTSLPFAIRNLAQLTRLELGTNELSDLPESLGELQMLQELILDGNRFSFIPESVFRLSNLRKLSLSSNQLDQVPEHLAQFHNLEELDLLGNHLSLWPEAVTHLRQLRVLSMGQNGLQEIPSSIGQMTNLEELHLDDNNLHELPVEISQLNRLSVLKIDGNPLTVPPLDVAEQGTQAVKEYLRNWGAKSQQISNALPPDRPRVSKATHTAKVTPAIEEATATEEDRGLEEETSFTDFAEIEEADPVWPVIAEDGDEHHGIRWVLVAGTNKVYLEDVLRWASREVGEALARHGFKLVVGGERGVDHLVARAFVDELPLGQVRANDYCRQIVWGNQPHFPAGEQISVPPGSEGYGQSVQMADAVVLIGGRGGTYSVFRAAKAQGKPVLPLPATGGVADQAFREILEKWNEQVYLGLPHSEFEKLGRKLNTVRDVVAVINHILWLLQFFNAPEDKRAELLRKRQKPQTSPPVPAPSVPPGWKTPVLEPGRIPVAFVVERDEPPPDILSFTITAQTVTLKYADQIYTGANRLNSNKLRAIEYLPNEYGKMLFQGIIHDEPAPGNGPATTTRRGYDNARRDNPQPLRIELFLHSFDEALQALKWEYLLDDKDGNAAPLAVARNTAFYRRLQSNALSDPATAQPLKVLVAICNPVTLGDEKQELLKSLMPLDVERERAIIETGLKGLNNAVTWEVLDGTNGPQGRATLHNLGQRLKDGYHILHIVCHGIFHPGRKEYFLIMENDEGRHAIVSATEFRESLQQSQVRLVILAACQSADAAATGALRALGPNLVRDGIPAVIAMQEAVPIETAQLFAQYFYNDLARSGDVDMAMAATRHAIYMHDGPKSGKRHWGIAALFMGTDNGHLLDVEPIKAQVPSLPPAQHIQLPLHENDGSKTQMLGQDVKQLLEGRNVSEDLINDVVNAVTATIAASNSGSVSGAEAITAIERESLRQNRESVTERITAPVTLNARTLEALAQHKGLSFPAAVYNQTAAALNGGKHVILIGPPGTGKTTLAHLICQHARTQNFTAGTTLTTATADWTTFDTVGGYVPTARQTLRFRPGIVLQSIRQGHWLVVDEINRADIDKAFGQLFTVLSGQQADLPYQVGENLVRVLPPSSGNGAAPNLQHWWDIDQVASDFDYVVHPNWRMLATMNVYDRSSLFNMSFAFMRRFAFVDVALPEGSAYLLLLGTWLDGFLQELSLEEPQRQWLKNELIDKELKFILDAETPLMRRRALGPAILRDMLVHFNQRYQSESIEPADEPKHRAQVLNLLGEAFLLYAVPQLDGLDHEGITSIYAALGERFGGTDGSINNAILTRVRSFYPHIEVSAWPSIVSPLQEA